MHTRRLKQGKHSFSGSPIPLSALDSIFIFHLFFSNPPINFKGEKRRLRTKWKLLSYTRKKEQNSLRACGCCCRWRLAVYGELAGEFDLNDGDDRCSLETASLRDCEWTNQEKKMLLNILAAAACFRRHKSISAIGINSTLAAAVLVWPHDLTAVQLRRNATQNTYHSRANHFPVAARAHFFCCCAISMEILIVRQMAARTIYSPYQ